MLSSKRVLLLYWFIAVCGLAVWTSGAQASERSTLASEFVGPLVATTLLATHNAEVQFVHRRYHRHRHGYRGYRYRPYGYRHHRRYRTYWYYDGYRYRSYRRYY